MLADDTLAVPMGGELDRLDNNGANSGSSSSSGPPDVPLISKSILAWYYRENRHSDGYMLPQNLDDAIEKHIAKICHENHPNPVSPIFDMPAEHANAGAPFPSDPWTQNPLDTKNSAVCGNRLLETPPPEQNKPPEAFMTPSSNRGVPYTKEFVTPERNNDMPWKDGGFEKAWYTGAVASDRDAIFDGQPNGTPGDFAPRHGAPVADKTIEDKIRSLGLGSGKKESTFWSEPKERGIKDAENLERHYRLSDRPNDPFNSPLQPTREVWNGGQRFRSPPQDNMHGDGPLEYYDDRRNDRGGRRYDNNNSTIRMPYGPRDPQRYPPHMNRRPFNGGDHNMNRQDMGMPPTDDFRGDFFPTGSFEAWGDNRRRFQDSGPHNRFPRREPFAGNARHGGDNSAWPTF